LSVGLNIQQLGLGVYKVPQEQAQETVTSSLDIGYRHIDTASFYGNELGVGGAIKQSNIPRSDIFVTTKVWNDEQGYDNTLRAFEQSLDKLELEDVDLYLIHWPVPEKFSETWRALERLYEEGRVKAIGVSNFLDHHLRELFTTANVKPTVDQIELHPKLFQTSTVDFCRANDIVVQSWSPLGRANYLEDEQLIQIAKKYHK